MAETFVHCKQLETQIGTFNNIDTSDAGLTYEEAVAAYLKSYEVGWFFWIQPDSLAHHVANATWRESGKSESEQRIPKNEFSPGDLVDVKANAITGCITLHSSVTALYQGIDESNPDFCYILIPGGNEAYRVGIKFISHV